MLYAGSMNDKKRAKEAYTMAYKYKNIEAATYIGMIEEEKGNFKEAEKWFLKGIEKHGRKFTLLFGLAEFYEEVEEYEKAEKIYKEFIKNENEEIKELAENKLKNLKK